MQSDNEKWLEVQEIEHSEDTESNHDYELIRAYADQLNGEAEASEE